MRFNCGPTKEERHLQRVIEAKALYAKYTEWHPHFAWFPVRVGDGECRWLETVNRRGRNTSARQALAYSYEYEFIRTVSCAQLWDWEYMPL